MNRKRSTFAIVKAGLLCSFCLGSPTTQEASAQGPAPIAPKAADAAAEKCSLDEPLAWMREAKRNYSAVKDYTCTLWKKENIGGRLSDDHVIQFKFRQAPFSVAMRWLTPKAQAGTEALFIMGKNNNKMRVHAKGIKGLAGWVSIDVNDTRERDDFA